MIDVNQALLDPASVFQHPFAVLSEAHITQAQKIEILKRWEYSVKELLQAEEENMTGHVHPNLLRQIRKALRQLEKL